MNKSKKINANITEVKLRVSDLEKSKDFYRDIVMLDILEENENEVFLGSNSIPLVVLSNTHYRNQNQEGLYHIAFTLKNESQLANWMKDHLSSEYIVGATHHGVSKAIYLTDPDGNGVEIYIDTPQEEWDRVNKEIRMVSKPLNISDLLEKTTDEKVYDIQIGHLHLQVMDVEKASVFYQALGLDITFKMSGAVFMSYQGYHHHIAVNQWRRFGLKKHDDRYSDIKEFSMSLPLALDIESIKKKLEDIKMPYKTIGSTIEVIDPHNIKIKLKGEKL